MIDVAQLIAATKAEARPYQTRIVKTVFNDFTEKALRSILIESPTGSGKTIIALLISKAMHELANMRIGWVAMRRHLLQQVEKENKAKGFDVPLKYISMFDKEPPSGLDMLVIDEAQHDVTSSMAHIHAVVEPKHILGLSATPFRADRVKLCFDKVVKDAGIAALIMENYLSPFHHYTIPKWGVDEVTDCYLAEPARWGKSIIYFHRLAECMEARTKLLSAGVSCDVVSGSSDTEQQIEDFYNDKIHILINCMKLTEGFDCPDLKTVFCRPSCKSVTMQMAGRVLRKHPDHPFKQIVQTKKTPYVFTKTALAALQFIKIDNGWRTLQVNPHINAINQRCIIALAKTDVQLPEIVKKAMQYGPLRQNRRQFAQERENAENDLPESHELMHHG